MFALRIIEDPSLVANRVTNKDALDVVRLQTFALVLLDVDIGCRTKNAQ